MTTDLRIRGARRSLGRPLACAAGLCAALLGGCRADMQDQPRYEVNGASAFFPDGRADRPLVKGVVSHGSVHDDPAFDLGTKDGAPVDQVPVPMTRDLLARGRERYDIYCSPCHSRVGDGNGMIVQRGYKRPPSFHIERLRGAPAGYFFDTITHGFGVMPSYAAQVPVADRWAIVAYVRALQLSEHATLADVPDSERARLQSGAASTWDASSGSPAPSAHAAEGDSAAASGGRREGAR